MSFRCPLCLKLLNEREQMTRYCTEHPDRDETFPCFPHLLPHKIFCTADDCGSADEIERGVFLRHTGCEEHNPFWDGNKVVVPGHADASQGAFSLDFGTGVDKSHRVQHWLLAVLRDLPGDKPEMWFPLMLLRATGERNGRARVGRFIELAGAQAAGKTILAVQAMSPHGYAGGYVDVGNFIFSRREGDLSDPRFRAFIETLHLSSLLQNSDHEIFVPRGTPPGPRNLKVAFFRPTDGLWMPLSESERNLKGHAKRLFKLFVRGAHKFLVVELHASFREITGAQSHRPYRHTLAFYDKSGEAEENEDIMRDTLDKVAVVVNAAEIFGLKTEPVPAAAAETTNNVLEGIEDEIDTTKDPAGKTKPQRRATEKSIKVAVQRLRKAAERKQLCYLVVTQLDLVKKEIGDKDWPIVEELAGDLTRIGRDRGVFRRTLAGLLPPRPSTAQRLVEKWLGPRPVGNRKQLKERLKDVEEIFFVWTEDLPTSRTPTEQARLPVSRGLAKFACRCLDITWDQIDRGDRG